MVSVKKEIKIVGVIMPLCVLSGGSLSIHENKYILSLQVAMVQFTDDPRTEFKLNAYNTKETLLDAIKRISYKGGNTKTGKNNSKNKTQQRPRVVHY